MLIKTSKDFRKNSFDVRGDPLKIAQFIDDLELKRDSDFVIGPSYILHLIKLGGSKRIRVWFQKDNREDFKKAKLDILKRGAILTENTFDKILQEVNNDKEEKD